jgi:parvulin-like peptidyl-prolyl isomerase
MHILFKFPVSSLALLLLCSTVHAENPASSDSVVDLKAVFARVGDAVITVQAYQDELRREARNRFYHTQPPANVLAEFQREVADQLIARVLLLREAGRRQLQADPAALNTRLDRQRQRLQRREGGPIDETSDSWRTFQYRVEEDLLIEKLEQQVRSSLPAPTGDDLQAYYAANPDKFTEPEKLHLSTILLRVDPTAPAEAWAAARQEATAIISRARDGADFAKLASLHSSDKTAENGGDMGYIHMGMLSDGAQELINRMEPGTISDPVTVLEGIVFFKLHDRQTALLREFSEVEDRVQKLWRKETEDQRWLAFIAQLKSGTTIEIEEKYLNPSGEAHAEQSAMETDTS